MNGVLAADPIMNELVSSELSDEDWSAYRRATDCQRDEVTVALMMAAKFADCSAMVRRPEGIDELDPDERRAVAFSLDAVQEMASGAESQVGMSMTADGSFDSEVLDLPPISGCGVFPDGSPWLVDEAGTYWLGSSSSSDQLVCASLVKTSRGYQLQTRSPIGLAAEKPPPLEFFRTEDWRRAFAGDRTRIGEIRSIENLIETLERAESDYHPLLDEAVDRVASRLASSGTFSESAVAPRVISELIVYVSCLTTRVRSEWDCPLVVWNTFRRSVEYRVDSAGEGQPQDAWMPTFDDWEAFDRAVLAVQSSRVEPIAIYLSRVTGCGAGVPEFLSSFFWDLSQWCEEQVLPKITRAFS